MGKSIVTSLEIGTSNTVVLVGEALNGGRVRVIGLGSARTAGVRKGMIIDLSQVQTGIQTAVHQAEESANVAVGQVLLAVSGAHIDVSQNESQRPVLDADGKVSREDIADLRELARACRLDSDRTVLHALSQSYRLDSLCDIPNPFGMHGKQLHLGSLLIHGQRDRIDDAVNLLKGLAIDTRDVAFSALAAATAVLSEEQRAHGVVLIDLGGGTTNYVVVNRRVVVAAGSLGVGGDHVTNDIAQAFGISQKQAEEIKLSDGCAMIREPQAGNHIKLPANMITASARSIHVKDLHTVIEARMRETLEVVRDQLDTELRQTGSGVIFTGGGAYLPGLNELAGRVFGVPVKTGELIHEIEGLPRDATKPACLATVAGLLLRSAQTQNDTLGGSFIAKIGDIFGLAAREGFRR